MFGFGQLIGILKKSPKKIVFTEGEDSRILEASSRLLASNFLHPILIGNEEKIMNAAEESGFNIRGAEIIDPEKYEKMDEMVKSVGAVKGYVKVLSWFSIINFVMLVAFILYSLGVFNF